jgi:hypothetical protein
MSNNEEVRRLVNSLKAENASERERAAAELSDFIESRQLSDALLRTVLESLLRAVVSEIDPSVRETMCNALSSGYYSPVCQQIDWAPLLAALDTFDDDCLEHALVILGFTSDTKYRVALRRFLNHPENKIRETAQASLDELSNSSKQPVPKN